MALIDLARQMGKEIQASDEYKALEAAKTANDGDAALQEKIGDFNLRRIELSTEMSAQPKNDEKIAKLNDKLQAIYTEIMTNENMSAFNVAKQNLDAMMNNVQTILMMCLNGEDPETCQIPEQGCSGSCSSCGGCH